MAELQSRVETSNARVDITENHVRTQIRDFDERSELLEMRVNECENRNGENSDRNEVEILGTIAPTSEDQHSRPRNNHNDKSVHASNTVRGQAPILSLPSNFINEVNLPKFFNKNSEHPLKFLKDLEQYFTLRSVPEHLKISVVKHALQAETRTWLELYESDDLTYDSFKSIFEDHFWGIQRQTGVRNEIVHGKYDAKKNRNIVDYAIQLHQKAQYLTPKFKTHELVSHIANHYSPDIRSSIIVCKPQNIKDLIQLLKELQPTSYGRNPHIDRHSDNVDSKDNFNFYSGEGANNYTSNKTVGPRSPQKNNSHRSSNSPPPNSNNQTDSHPGHFNENRKPFSNNYRPNNFQNRNQGNFNRSQGNTWNRQNFKPRINHINFDSGNGNWNNNTPHWFRRRKYNNNHFRSRHYSHRYNPYPHNGNNNGNPSNNNHNNNRNNNGQNHNGNNGRAGRTRGNRNRRQEQQNPAENAQNNIQNENGAPENGNQADAQNNQDLN